MQATLFISALSLIPAALSAESGSSQAPGQPAARVLIDASSHAQPFLASETSSIPQFRQTSRGFLRRNDSLMSRLLTASATAVAILAIAFLVLQCFKAVGKASHNHSNRRLAGEKYAYEDCGPLLSEKPKPKPKPQRALLKKILALGGAFALGFAAKGLVDMTTSTALALRAPAAPAPAHAQAIAVKGATGGSWEIVEKTLNAITAAGVVQDDGIRKKRDISDKLETKEHIDYYFDGFKPETEDYYFGWDTTQEGGYFAWAGGKFAPEAIKLGERNFTASFTANLKFANITAEITTNIFANITDDATIEDPKYTMTLTMDDEKIKKLKEEIKKLQHRKKRGDDETENKRGDDETENKRGETEDETENYTGWDTTEEGGYFAWAGGEGGETPKGGLNATLNATLKFDEINAEIFVEISADSISEAIKDPKYTLTLNLNDGERIKKLEEKKEQLLESRKRRRQMRRKQQREQRKRQEKEEEQFLAAYLKGQIELPSKELAERSKKILEEKLKRFNQREEELRKRRLKENPKLE